jgi:hypothetical protein
MDMTAMPFCFALLTSVGRPAWKARGAKPRWASTWMKAEGGGWR